MQRLSGDEVFGFVQRPESIDSIILRLQESLANYMV